MEGEPNDATQISDDEFIADHVDQSRKILLPSRPPVEGRQYITVKRKAGYWVHFRDYMENGRRRSECIYCENKNFASDGNKNGSKNIRNNWNICPANPDAPINKSKGKQTELVFDRMGNDGEGQLRGWTLNLNEVREAVVYMIIIDELPFRFVEKPGFKRLMSVTCPSFHIPSRITIARDVYKLYLNERSKLKGFVLNSSQRVSFTTDTWNSIQKVNYMCLTAHFVDNEWNLHKKIIVFCPIYSHKGKDIANLLDDCFKSWGLEDKVFTLTVDNASSNDTACIELKKLLQKKQNLVARGNYMHVRCVAHIINRIVWDGLKANKKSINKVRYAVKFAKSSPNRLQYFKQCARKYTQCQLSLSLDCSTR
ncbi:hypothetical protein RND81_04G179600 [Saponaria officinalis]|uniref:Zinc finger BED domain-containing protein RICESLEEPER 2-like n=1 Tax=Saponaria officinalis TaxID=3572 RepID=A0AAW1LM23_SAPOF